MKLIILFILITTFLFIVNKSNISDFLENRKQIQIEKQKEWDRRYLAESSRLQKIWQAQLAEEKAARLAEEKAARLQIEKKKKLDRDKLVESMSTKLTMPTTINYSGYSSRYRCKTYHNDADSITVCD